MYAAAGRASNTVPGKRKRADQSIQQALRALRSALTDAGVPWMVIGGIAVIARGVRRMTTDIDIAVRGDAIDVETLLAHLARYAIVPRVDNALGFARANLVLLLRHEKTDVELDVSLSWTTFEYEALAARTRAAFGDVMVPMAAPEDLVIMKALAARPTDIQDAVTLLTLYPKIDLVRVRRTLAQLAAAADAPELTEGLQLVLQELRAQPRRPRAPRTRTASTRRKRRR